MFGAGAGLVLAVPATAGAGGALPSALG
jgi:hypothetical protein